MELDRSDDEENEPQDPDIPTVRLEAAQFQQLLSPYHDVAESDNEGLELDSTWKKCKRNKRRSYFKTNTRDLSILRELCGLRIRSIEKQVNERTSASVYILNCPL